MEHWTATVRILHSNENHSPAFVVRYTADAWMTTEPTKHWTANKTFDALVGPKRTCPQWLAQGIVYQIVPDRFSPSPGAHFNTPEDFLEGVCTSNHKKSSTC